jgi:hypothetical protein
MPLSEALQRVIATGVAKKEAKRNISEAIANRNIKVRFYFMMRPTQMTFLTGRHVPTRVARRIKGNDIPPILKPIDFDWWRSQVRKPELWQQISGPFGSFFGNWQIIEKAGDPLLHSQRGDSSLTYQHRLELHSTDVMKILCSNDRIHDEQAGVIPKTKLGGAKSRGIAEAIKQLWPNGIPTGLSAKERDNSISKQLGFNGSSVPHDLPRAVQRVLQKIRNAQRPK